MKGKHMRGRKYKFPSIKDCAPKDPILLCPADRVIALYNQATGKASKKIAKRMKEWFAQEAKRNQWAECLFVPEIQSKHGAGCVLLNPHFVQINLKQIIIQIENHETIFNQP